MKKQIWKNKEELKERLTKMQYEVTGEYVALFAQDKRNV